MTARANDGVGRPTAFYVGNASPDHGEWKKGITGRLDLSFTTFGDRYVTPGTGELAVAEDGGRDILAQGAARSDGRPVLPGSGIKGAVRTLYEILTGSCSPTGERSVDCTRDAPCSACRLFGPPVGRGLKLHQGRIGFDDARPASADAVEVTMERVPEGHEPHGEHTRGDYRLYDLDPGRFWNASAERTVPREPILAREVYRGRFEGRAAFWSLSTLELGLLILALGRGPAPDVRFPLRLGGVRFHGQGAVEVEVEGLVRVDSALDRTRLDAQEARTQADDWARQALEQLPAPNRRVLVETAAILNRRSS